MSPFGQRLAVPAAAAALLLAACGSSSDGAVDDASAVGSTAVESESDDAALLEEVEVADAAAGDDADSSTHAELPECPNLPANVWPEDCVVVEGHDASADDAEADGTAADSAEAAAPVGLDKSDLVTSVGGDAVRPEGFTAISAQVTSPDGVVCEVCLWLADSRDERSRGLMGVTDLGDAVGMAFVWDELVDGNFWMFQTPTPLSIAFFDDAGDHVGQADMDPCLATDSDLCVRYGADRPYSTAVEMFGGQLGAVGIAAGSSIELLVGTEAPTCPIA